MRIVRAWLSRIAAALGGERGDGDFAAELESHLQLHVDDNIHAGMGAAEARRAALIALGGVTQTTERYRERRGLPWLDSLRQDTLYAIRVLRKNPGFTATAVVTLALGIGANSAIFTVVHAVLLRPLPYPGADRLVSVVQWQERSGSREWATWPDYEDWRAHSTRLQALGAAWPIAFNLTRIEEPERLSGAAITANVIPLLDVPPLLGRAFVDPRDEDPRSAVLAYGLWKRRFAADRHVVGRKIELNGRTHTVVGVMPEGFAFPPGAELWVPFVPEPGMTRGYHLLTVVGRLAHGATIDEARAELRALAAQAAAEYPATNKEWGVQIASLLDGEVSAVRPAMLVLAVAVGCVLLIACANVAALLMSRGAARRHEIAVRAALGASRARIVRQLLTESVVLSLCGGTAGLLIAGWSLDPLLGLTTLPRAREIGLDLWVLVFTVGLSVATGICFGLAPAVALIRQGGTPIVPSRTSTPLRGLRPTLVAIEIALTVALLVSAGVLVRSVARLQQVDVGFNADRVLTMRFFLPRASYAADRAARHYQDMIGRLSALPEVERVAAISHFPFSNLNANMVFSIDGRPPAPPGEALTAEFRSASPRYFDTMGIALVSGRDFSDFDKVDAPLVAIVNRAMADRFFPGEDPLVHSVRLLGPKPRRIIGIVENVRHRGVDHRPEPEVYVPHAQYPLGGMFLAVRVRSGDPARLAAAARAEIRSVDRDLPIASVSTVRELVGVQLSRRRFTMTLLALFASTALLLSATGVYGVLSFTMLQRTREIGIRMALGAARRDVLVHAVRQGMAPVVVGLLAGIAASLGATPALTEMLYEIAPHDGVTLAVVCALLLLTAAFATFIPARRASLVDPLLALRHE